MNRSKVNFEDRNTSVVALIPKMESATKSQILSFISLMMSVICILTPLTPLAAAEGSVAYHVSKNATAVNGIPGGNVTAAGDRISYQITVNNTAEGNLTNVTVTDPLINNLTGPFSSMSDPSYWDNKISHGEAWTYYGNYTVTQADIDNNGNGTGFIINNVTVVCDQNATATNATATTPIANCTIVKIVTSVTGGLNGNVTAAGNIVRYRINVVNGGQVNLTNVTVSDPMLGLTNVTNLGVGTNETLYGNYTVTQANMDSNGNGTGFIINNATVASDQLGPKNATATTPIANCTIVKTVTGVTGGLNGNVTAAGNIVRYRINVVNGGQVNLTNVTVSDPMLGLTNVTNLGVGTNETLYGNYTVTQANIDNDGNGTGFIINNATVLSDQLGPKNATVQTPIKSCTFSKIVTDVAGQGPEGNVTAAGDIISYEINVNDTAGMDLTNVTVIDPMLGGLLLNMTNLGMGSNETVYGNYTVTQADIDNNGNGAGFIINNATVDCDQLGPKNSTVQVPIIRNPNYSIFKSVISPDPNGDCIVNSPGDEVPYQIVVQNEGNVDLTNVTVNDTLVSLPDPTGDVNNDNILNPGETWIYNAIYTLTSDDVANGYVNNTAIVSCDQLPAKSSSVNTNVVKNPDLQIYKSVTGIDEVGDHMINNLGDVINYQVAIKNTGNMALTGVSVDDPMVDLTKTSGDNNNSGILNPGETWEYKGDYSVTQSDIDTDGNGTGLITNTATVHSNELPDESSSIQIPIVTASNTQTDTITTPDNTSANGSEPQPTTTNLQPTPSSNNVESSGGSGGSSGGSIGSASVVGSSSTVNTPATNITQPETSASNIDQSNGNTPANTEQTPVQTATTTPTTSSKKSPGFEIIGGITAMLGAVYLYRKR
jgi:uncharacterized repeat protein (TIGR01451 family)